ncbi:MAG: cbb3-type cytochrome c oxidase subunit I, partial [Chthoniobacterales bacterium]
MAGVLMAIPPADFELHNSLFLVAHFHTMIVSGVLFGFFAAMSYWFPKIFGFKLEERWGVRAFWLWVTGFILAFGPLYILGIMGATRRLDHYTDPSWQPLFIVAGVGAVIIAMAVACQVAQVVASIRKRHELRDTTGDPWNGRTLEWSVASPAPFYNFAEIPVVEGRDAWWLMKKNSKSFSGQVGSITLPKNTPLGMYMAACFFAAGFCLVWHIWWLAAVAVLAFAACIVVRSFTRETEHAVTI